MTTFGLMNVVNNGGNPEFVLLNFFHTKRIYIRLRRWTSVSTNKQVVKHVFANTIAFQKTVLIVKEPVSYRKACVNTFRKLELLYVVSSAQRAMAEFGRNIKPNAESTGIFFFWLFPKKISCNIVFFQVIAL